MGSYSLVPRPFQEGGGGKDLVSLFAHAQDFLGISKYSNCCLCSKRHLEVELHCISELRMAASAEECECSAFSAFSAAIAFSLGKLWLSHTSLKKKQRSVILVVYQGQDVFVSPNRVWKSIVLPVSTFLDGLQEGQLEVIATLWNVLAKQSPSCLVSPPMFGRH